MNLESIVPRIIPSIGLGCLGLVMFLVARADAAPKLKTIQVHLSEWTVTLEPKAVPPGPVEFDVINSGTIPHAFEVEGRGIEKALPQMKPGEAATLTLSLPAGTYETYCPVGKNSHKMLGMVNHLTVGRASHAAAASGDEHAGLPAEANEAHEDGHSMAMRGDEGEASEYGRARIMNVVGGGPVIQILPGPYPFADSAAAIIANRPPDQQADLTKKSHMGPYSNNVAKIAGDISLTAIDHGATGDSVSGVASFTGSDGARWKVVMDRVQTQDIPYNPRFGGVIMGLYYHGASGVHTPLVPTIQSSLALWAFAHLYKNDQLVTDDAMVHIMLLSRTRRTSDWALDCWDCSDRPIEELQLQVTPAPNTQPFDSPGGFLFVNWEKSQGKLETR